MRYYLSENHVSKLDLSNATRIQAVLDAINLYGDDVLHKALDDIGFKPRNVS